VKGDMQEGVLHVLSVDVLKGFWKRGRRPALGGADGAGQFHCRRWVFYAPKCVKESRITFPILKGASYRPFL
jgi:hypothetical protein